MQQLYLYIQSTFANKWELTGGISFCEVIPAIALCFLLVFKCLSSRDLKGKAISHMEHHHTPSTITEAFKCDLNLKFVKVLNALAKLQF